MRSFVGGAPAGQREKKTLSCRTWRTPLDISSGCQGTSEICPDRRPPRGSKPRRAVGQFVVAGLVEREPAVDQRLIHGDFRGDIDASNLVDHSDRAGERGVAHHTRVQVVLKATSFSENPKGSRS